MRGCHLKNTNDRVVATCGYMPQVFFGKVNVNCIPHLERLIVSMHKKHSV